MASFFYLVLIYIFLIISGVILSVFAVSPATTTMRTLISLIFVFFITAWIMFILGFEFIGFVYITIYLGAISVFFLFIVMMTDLRSEKHQAVYATTNLVKKWQFIFITVFIILFSFIIFICLQDFRTDFDKEAINYITCGLRDDFFRLKLENAEKRLLVNEYAKKLLHNEIAPLNLDYLNSSILNQMNVNYKYFTCSSAQDLVALGYDLFCYNYGTFIVLGFILLVAMIGSLKLALHTKLRK